MVIGTTEEGYSTTSFTFDVSRLINGHKEEKETRTAPEFSIAHQGVLSL
jgi:hypothetical protein